MGAALEGLDYHSVEVVMRRQGVRGAAADEVFAQVQVMESEMLRLCNVQARQD